MSWRNIVQEALEKKYHNLDALKISGALTAFEVWAGNPLRKKPSYAEFNFEDEAGNEGFDIDGALDKYVASNADMVQTFVKNCGLRGFVNGILGRTLADEPPQSYILE